MKKIISVVSVALVLCCIFCLFTACKDDNAGIVYTLEETTYEVGDTFSTGDATITAVYNGEKIKIDTHLVFDTEALEEELEDGKFTKAGTYTVAVYAVENRSDLKIGDWKITVTEKE